MYIFVFPKNYRIEIKIIIILKQVNLTLSKILLTIIYYLTFRHCKNTPKKIMKSF